MIFVDRAMLFSISKSIGEAFQLYHKCWRKVRKHQELLKLFDVITAVLFVDPQPHTFADKGCVLFSPSLSLGL